MITPEFQKNAEAVLKWLQKHPKATQAGGGVTLSDVVQGSGFPQKDADEVIEYLTKRILLQGLTIESG